MFSRYVPFVLLVAGIVLPGGCQGPGMSSSVGDANNGGELTVPDRQQQTETIPFNLYGMVCEECPETAEKKLKQHPDVLAAKVMFDSKTGWVRVKKDRDINREDIRRLLKRTGKRFTAVFPGEDVPEKYRKETEKKGVHQMDEKVISYGEKVNLETHIARGRITIFDFYAKWCRGCQLLAPKLMKLSEKHSNIAIRRIDIQAWSSPAARQAIEQYTMAQIPYVRIYGKDGSFLGNVQGNNIERIRSLIPGIKTSTQESSSSRKNKLQNTSDQSRTDPRLAGSGPKTEKEKTRTTYLIDVTDMR